MAIKLEDWLPQEPNQGPPLPEFLNIYWPWYKPPEIPGAELAIELGGADPNALVEGTTYPVTVKVTNKSTKLGVASPATFTVKTSAVLAGVNLFTPVSEQATFAAGESKLFTYNFTIPAESGGKSGSITATVFDPSMKQIAQGSLAIAVQVAVLSGRLTNIMIYYTGLADWIVPTSGQQVPVGADISLIAAYQNTSGVSIIGHVDTLVIYPNGANVYVPAATNQDRNAPPNTGFSVQFTVFITNQEGTYSISITLSSGGVVLDTLTFTLVAVAEIVYGADVVVSV